MFVLLRDVGDGVRDDLEGLIDTCTALVVSVLVLWDLMVAPVLDDHHHEPARPARVGRPTRPWTRSSAPWCIRAVVSGRASSAVGRLLVAGTTLWLVADLGRTGGLGGHHRRAARHRLDGRPGAPGARPPGWPPHTAAPTSAAPPSPRPVARRVTPWRVAVAVSPLLVPAGLEIWSDGRGLARTGPPGRRHPRAHRPRGRPPDAVPAHPRRGRAAPRVQRALLHGPGRQLRRRRAGARRRRGAS